MTLKIRNETASDVAAIEAVTIAAFHDAEHTSHTEHFIVNALRHAGQLTLSLVADDDGAVVGHVAISPIRLSIGPADWFGLGPLSVLPQRQRQGIGVQLMNHAIAQLRSMDSAGCVLLGDPHYYQRFGFKAESALVLPDVPPEYFLAIAFEGAIPAAVVAYHDAFNLKAAEMCR